MQEKAEGQDNMQMVETKLGDSSEKSIGSNPDGEPAPTLEPGLKPACGSELERDGDLTSNSAGNIEASEISAELTALGNAAVSELQSLTGLQGSAAGEAWLTPIGDLQPSKLQPRRRFEEVELHALAESIKQHGLLQPIVVRQQRSPPTGYEIVFGERRWRAAVIAGLAEVPTIVRDLSDGDVLVAALVENLQRQDLTPIEEAEGYRRLIEEFEYTQASLAMLVGKSRSAVANALRLLNLPDEIREALQQGQLTAGHARALINADEPVLLARRAIKENLSVREIECLTRKSNPRPSRGKATNSSAGGDLKTLEKDLSDLLGLRAKIAVSGESGSITLHYDSMEQLDDFLSRLEKLRRPAGLT